MFEARFSAIAQYGSAVLLLGLIAHNVYWAIDTQSLDDPRCEARVCSGPRDIEAKARRSGRALIRDRVAVFYYFGQHLEGATIRMPTSFMRYRWFWERVARIHAKFPGETVLINKRQQRCVRAHATGERRWYTKAGQRTKRMFFVVQPTENKYVVAESRSAFYVVPRTLLNGACK